MSEFEQSQVYTPENDHELEEMESDQVYKRRVEKFNKNSIEGKWTEEQNLKYILYMDYHSKIFVSKEKRKSQRIFKSLSEFLSTRTPRQCRSHFQKIMNKFKKLKKVKQYYQEEIGIGTYQIKFDVLSEELKQQNVKLEETEAQKCVNLVHEGVQTDPMKINLADLSNEQMVKLINIYYEYQKIQMPFTLWANHCNQSKAKQGEWESQ